MLPPAPYRVVVAHPDTTRRAALTRAFRSWGGFTVEAEVSTGRDTVTEVRRRRPDVVVLHVLLPATNGLRALPLVRAASPESIVMILSAAPRMRMSRSALRRGADLCEADDLPDEEIVQRVVAAIRLVDAPRTRPS